MGRILYIVFILSLVSQISPRNYEEYNKKFRVDEVLEVRLAGSENDDLWYHRMQGLVLLTDRHNNTVRLCNEQLTEFEIQLMCNTLGYSQGHEIDSREMGLKGVYDKYNDLLIVTNLECQGTEIALEQCPRWVLGFGCNWYEKKATELYCVNPWYGYNTQCGTDYSVETAAENNEWFLNDSLAIELGELTGAQSRSLQEQPMRQKRLVQSSQIRSVMEFPWTAKLNFWNRLTNEWEYRCMAAILTDRVLLTLASCVDNIGNYSVTVGEFDREVSNRFIETFQVLTDIVHPKFTQDPKNNDIAIVVVKDKDSRGIDFGLSVLPVCLPAEDAPVYSGGMKAVVAGWGRQDTPQSATISRFFAIARVNLYYKDDCKGHEENNPSIVCAGNEEGGSDACFFDQGAPLISKINGRSLLVGLLKQPGCGLKGKPSQYVSIRHHREWIVSEVKKISAALKAEE